MGRGLRAVKGGRLRFLLAGVFVVGASLVPLSGAVADPSNNGMVFYGEYNSGNVWYSYLGGGADGIAVGGNVSGTGVDTATSQVFWADDSTNKIMVAGAGDPAGTKAELSTTGATKSSIRGLVVDAAGGKIYWANELADKISWAYVDGSGGGDINTSGATVSGPAGVALDTAHHRIYWANGASNTHPISWADTSVAQSGGGDLAVTGATADSSRGPSIDFATGKIYWSNLDNNTISYANLDGSGGGGQLNVSGATINGPHGTAIDPDTGYIYWINYGTSQLPISYAALDGSGGQDMGSHYGTAPLFPSLVEGPAGTAAATGESGAGNTLTCTASWKGDDPGALLYRAPSSGTTYQWTSDGNPIGGATSSTYVIQPGDLGHELRCQATASVLATGNGLNPYLFSTTLTSNAISAENVVAERVFFANEQSNTISWATYDGSQQGSVVTTGATVDDPTGVAVDAAANRVWWANGAANTISYADIDGAGGHDLDVGGAPVSTPHAIAVDPVAGKVYWANIGSNTIGWANMDGSGGGTLDTSGAVVSAPTGITVDHAGSRVYWTNGGDQAHQVSYASTAGGGGHTFDTSAVAQDTPTGVAVDATGSKVLWINNSGLFAAGLDGGSPAALDTGAASFSTPRGLAIDHANNRVWWANSNLGLVSYANLDGSGGGADLSVGDVAPAAVALLGKPVNTAPPSVGGAITGSTVACAPGTWAGDDSGARLSRAVASSTYEWFRDGSPVGDTDSTYDVPAGDVGHQLTCQVTASNAGGSTSVTSAAVTVKGPPGLVYWSNAIGSIGWSNLDGSSTGDLYPTCCTGGTPVGTALDTTTGRVYWTDQDNYTIDYADALTGANRGSLDPGNVGVWVFSPRGLVLDKAAGKLYWADAGDGGINWMALDGSGGGTLAVRDSPATVNVPMDVAIDVAANRIYWVNNGDDAHPISWALLSDSAVGGNLNVAGASAAQASGLAIDSATGIVYWTNSANNTVSYAHLDGSGGGQVDTTGATLDAPQGIAVDDVHKLLVVTNDNSNTVSWISIGTPPAAGTLVGSGNTALTNSPLYPALVQAPANDALPQISGTAVPHAKLSCSKGTWADDDVDGLLYRRAASYAYKWTRNGAPISGATSSTLTLTPGDVGKTIACQVVATNLAGSTTAQADTVTPDAYSSPTRLVFAPVSSLVSGTPQDVSVTVEDAYGNTVQTPTTSVTIAKAAGSGTLTGLGSVDSSSGVATESLTGVREGSLRLVATAAGLKSATATLSVVPGRAVKLAWFTTSASARVGVSWRMKIYVQDAAGNTVTSARPSVTFASHGTGAVAGLVPTRATNGIATVTVVAKRVGTLWIQAASPGLGVDTLKFVVFS